MADEPEIKVEVTPGETPPAPVVPVIVVNPPAESEPETPDPMLELAERTGRQSAELETMRGQLSELTAEISRLRAELETPAEPEVTAVIPVEVPPPSADEADPEKNQPRRERGLLGRLFLGK